MEFHSDEVSSPVYCKDGQKLFNGYECNTSYERSQYLPTKELCSICVITQHSSAHCKKSSCFKCQERHHTSCCLESSLKESTFQNCLNIEPNRSNAIKVIKLKLGTLRHKCGRMSSTMSIKIGCTRPQRRRLA